MAHLKADVVQDVLALIEGGCPAFAHAGILAGAPNPSKGQKSVNGLETPPP
ncbi:MAG: hypothetical protein V9G14_06105 [Cypionkella sp.]